MDTALFYPGGMMKSVSAGSWGHEELRVPAQGLCHPLPHLLPDPVGQTKQGQKEATPRPARKSANQ